MLQVQDCNSDRPLRVCSQCSSWRIIGGKCRLDSEKKTELNGGPSRALQPPRERKPAQRTHLAKVDADFLPMMLVGSLKSALPVALLVRAEQLLRTHDEAGDDPTMALTRARHLPARDLRLRQSPPGSGPEDAPASGGETRPEREPRDV